LKAYKPEVFNKKPVDEETQDLEPVSIVDDISCESNEKFYDDSNDAGVDDNDKEAN
jgi:hypothetical protein